MFSDFPTGRRGHGRVVHGDPAFPPVSRSTEGFDICPPHLSAETPKQEP